MYWRDKVRTLTVALSLTGRAALAGLAAFFISPCAATTAATLSGTVTLPNGHGVRATLRIQDLSTPRTVEQAPFDRQFASKADGTFSLTGVPAGKYRICVDAPQANVLDPCLWSPTQPTYTVVAGTTPSKIAIQVQVGAMLHVLVNDPQAVLPAAHGGSYGGALSMVVMTGNRKYCNLRLLSSGLAGLDHYAIVPFGQSLMLVTQSSTLALSDGKNNALAGNSQSIPVRVPAGGSAPTIVLNVAKK